MSMKTICLNQLFFTGSIPPEDTWQCQETFLMITVGQRDAAGIWWGDDRNSATCCNA